MGGEADRTEELRAEVEPLRRQRNALSIEKAELAAALAARSDVSGATLAAVVEQLPVAIGVFQADGLLMYINVETERLFGVPREVSVGRFNAVTDPQSIALGTDAFFSQVLKGAMITSPPYRYDATQILPGGEAHGRVLWLETVYFPLVQPGGAVSHVATLNCDVTTLIEQKATLEATQGEIVLSTTRACRLLGCEAALVGIGSATAQAIVQLGVDLSGIVTRANLEAGIAWAFKRRDLSVA